MNKSKKYILLIVSGIVFVLGIFWFKCSLSKKLDFIVQKDIAIPMQIKNLSSDLPTRQPINLHKDAEYTLSFPMSSFVQFVDRMTWCSILALMFCWVSGVCFQRALKLILDVYLGD